jgi:hypothetical protein
MTHISCISTLFEGFPEKNASTKTTEHCKTLEILAKRCHFNFVYLVLPPFIAKTSFKISMKFLKEIFAHQFFVTNSNPGHMSRLSD